MVLDEEIRDGVRDDLVAVRVGVKVQRGEMQRPVARSLCVTFSMCPRSRGILYPDWI